MLYQGFCVLNCRFVTSRSRSIQFVTCDYVSGLDGVKSCGQAQPDRSANEVAAFLRSLDPQQKAVALAMPSGWWTVAIPPAAA
jgi:hypothetical protein